jgi:serine/threonine-protein kinase
VTAGASVTLVVASGANAVPAVAGRSEVAAGSAITAAGFIPAERTIVDTTVADGTVLGTEPASGISQPLGSTIVIVIARGPGPTPPPDATSTPSPPPTGTPVPTTSPSRP